jgi:hypothetical protein
MAPPPLPVWAGQPPPGYFSDWDIYAGQPVVVFPPGQQEYGPPGRMVKHYHHHHSRKHRSPHRSKSPRKHGKHRSKSNTRRRSVSPRYGRYRYPSPGPMVGPPPPPGPGPAYTDGYSSSSSESDYRPGRPRTPPADYRQDQDIYRHTSRREVHEHFPDAYDRRPPPQRKPPSDLIMYAPYRGYNNEGDEYFYDRRGGGGGDRNRSRERQRDTTYNQQKSTNTHYQGNWKRDASPDPDRHNSNFNPEIYMRETRDYR